MGNVAKSVYSPLAVSRLINAIVVIAIVTICWDIVSLILLVKDYTITYWLLLHAMLFIKAGGVWLFLSRKPAGWYLLSLLAVYAVSAALLAAGITIFSGNTAHGSSLDSIWFFNTLPGLILVVLLLLPAVKQSFKINAVKTGAVITGGILLAAVLLFAHI